MILFSLKFYLLHMYFKLNSILFQGDLFVCLTVKEAELSAKLSKNK